VEIPESIPEIFKSALELSNSDYSPNKVHNSNLNSNLNEFLPCGDSHFNTRKSIFRTIDKSDEETISFES